MRAVQSIDRFVEDHRARWARLGALVDRAQGRVARLSAEEVLELGALYRGATSDLAVARRDFPEDTVAERLNDVVAAAHALVYSEAPASGRRLRRFVARELPTAVRAAMPFTLVAFALVAIPAVVTFAAGLIQPDVASAALSEEARRALIQRTPGTEIPESLRPRIGPLIIVNNITVSIAAFAGGMTAGLYTVFILVLNGTELGTIFAVLQRAGVASSLLIFILAHGFLELSAIFLAGGAGLRLAWAILHPGDRTRRDALRIAGGQAMRVMLLVAATLVVAGLVEGFVSPTTLDPAGKLAVGLLSGLALWGYILLPYNQRFFNSR